MENSRKYKRRIYARNATVSVNDVSYQGVSGDVSAGGMFIGVKGPFTVGQRILVSVQLSNGKTQSLFHAEITRITDEGIAVSFLR